MAKRFAYVSFGILCLVVAFQLGAERARADWDATLPGSIIGFISNGSSSNGLAYTAGGEAWLLQPNAAWLRDSTYDLPVPASEVKFLTDSGGVFYLITNSDEGWVYNAGWQYAGLFPGGPVAFDDASWGKRKGAYQVAAAPAFAGLPLWVVQLVPGRSIPPRAGGCPGHSGRVCRPAGADQGPRERRAVRCATMPSSVSSLRTLGAARLGRPFLGGIT